MNLEPLIGKRILAGLIDYSIIVVFFFWFVYTYGEPNLEGGYTVNGLLAFIPMVFWGLMTIGMEQFFGATLGNMFLDLKPVSINGVDDKLSFGQSALRHIFDPVDMIPFGLVGILVINNSDKYQRVGDIVAKTVVLEFKRK